MRRPVGRLQALLADMRVALSGRHIGVAQQFLHSAKISAVVQQMSGIRVAQRMRMRGCERPCVDDASHVAGSQPSATRINEQRNGGRVGNHFRS